MTEFFKTGMGAKFYNSDVPNLILQLKRIADELVRVVVWLETDDEPEESNGEFAEISEKEQAELNAAMADYDKFFDQLMENFDLKELGDYIDHQSLKNLVRHAWNANK